MNRIDELIAKLCPEGVPFKPLGACVRSNKGGGTPSRDRAEFWDGDIPWASVGDITASKIALRNTRQNITEAGLRSSSSHIVPSGHVIVAVKIVPGALRVVERDVAINQDLRGLLLSAELDPYFLAYYFKTIRVVGDGTIVKGITNSTLVALRIPVPPLEVQREIVRILDKFTQLEAELEAELEARRRQYEHYRSELLVLGTETTLLPLEDLAQNLDNKRKPVTRDARTPGEIPYYGASGVVDYVSDFIFDGDYLLVSEDGANLLARSTPIAFSISGKTWVNNHAHVLRFETYAERRFVEIYLNSIDLSPFISGAAQPKLNKANLNRIPIPDPSLDEKIRVVGLLDKFDALVNDLNIGLPAELAARRKQYEYYRKKLLTFEEAS
ncbi:restriction endonuclease subunit S [Salinibacterium amurskyense]|uniref:restriction endonuclease subunit S n=1 Tax=Salinibacterium amurskyense TaxID=205941 RepID=UPI00311E97CE